MIENAAAREYRSDALRQEVAYVMPASAASLIDTSSEQYRHACETRHVANMPTDDARALYLAGVHEKRGKESWERLRNDAWAARKRLGMG